jgi:hypothetical protein
MIRTGRTRTRIEPGLSWEIAIGAVALEKLRQGEDVTAQETETLKGVAAHLTALAEAQALPVRVLLQGEATLGRRLRDSFATLVSLQRSQVGAQEIERLRIGGEKLGLICRGLPGSSPEGGGIDPEDLVFAQEVCLELLEYLDHAQVLEARPS